MTGIKYSSKALHDLQNIKDYVASEFSSEELAISVLKHLVKLSVSLIILLGVLLFENISLNGHIHHTIVI